jgi:hypothetical protein
LVLIYKAASKRWTKVCFEAAYFFDMSITKQLEYEKIKKKVM